MGRTLKRQQARARRGHDTISSSTPVASDDELWTKVEDALLGLLDIEVINSTTDPEHLFPRSVQLIVRLDLVRSGADKVERVLQRVMDTLGKLCVLLQDSGGRDEVWMRVLQSQMMILPWDAEEEEEKAIRDVATYTRVHGLHVVFAWQERKFQSYAADAVGAFLQTPRRKHERSFNAGLTDERPRLVRIGLQFVDCHLTTHDIDSVMKALVVEDLPADSDNTDAPLSRGDTLESLKFRGIPLGDAELEALAIGLARPHTRRVDSLSLENTLFFSNSPKYVPAFKSVLSAALQSKHSGGLTACPGLKLSLARNDAIQPAHVEALQEALSVATRPLAALSVAYTPSGDAATWLRLGQILFTPSLIQVDGNCELDINYITEESDAVEALSMSLGTLVGEMFPRVSAALLASDRVYCRVSDGNDENLSPLETYEVVSARASGESLGGWMQITAPSAEASSTWISSSSITNRISEEDIVGCRFTSLVAQGDDYLSTPEGVPRLLRWIGHGLRHLDLGARRYIARAWPAVVQTCPNLQVLDLQYADFSERIPDWSHMPLHSLKSINLRHCHLTAASMTDLLTRMLEAHQMTLRCLDLRGNRDFDSDTLDTLLQLLQKNRALVQVEMPEMCLASDIPEEMQLRRQLEAIDQYLAGEYLSPEIKLALLSVAGCRNDLRWDENIVRKIFSFTGSDEKREVGWKRSCSGRCPVCSRAQKLHQESRTLDR